MSKNISNTLRQKIAERAGFRCEYCLLTEAVSFYSFHAEHIRSKKHGGKSELVNLAYSCPDCNYFKGSDVATYGPDDEGFIRFFHPRKDNWEEHFEIKDGHVFGKTEIGKATESIFKFNDPERLIFRKQLIALGLYP